MANDTRCRIGKVRFKSGGFLKLLPNEKSPNENVRFAPKRLSSIISDETVMVGYFTMKADGSIRTGWNYEAGVTDGDFLGGIELLRQDWVDKEIHGG